jgi:DNA-binding NarL/FixJ family response regulator
MSHSVMLVDDQPVFRRGIHALLSREGIFDVVAEAQSLDEMRRKAMEHHPECVLIDTHASAVGGVHAIEALSETLPTGRFVVLSAASEREAVLSAVSAGAAGYLLKSCAPDELLEALRVVFEGYTYLSPAVATIVAGSLRSNAQRSQSTGLEALTAREREVMALLVDGHTTKQIAYQLSVSAKTVATHKDSIMGKLQTRSIAMLTRYAMTEGMLPSRYFNRSLS